MKYLKSFTNQHGERMLEDDLLQLCHFCHWQPLAIRKALLLTDYRWRPHSSPFSYLQELQWLQAFDHMKRYTIQDNHTFVPEPLSALACEG